MILGSERACEWGGRARSLSNQRGGSVHVKAGEIFQADLQFCHRQEEIRSNEDREVVPVEKGGQFCQR